MRTRPLVVVSLTVAFLALVPQTRAEAVTAEAVCGPLAPVDHWLMDEPANALTMQDATGTNHGRITSAETGVTPAASGFGAFYRFGRVSTEFPRGSQVSVPSAAGLNPGSCDFAVDAWVNWDRVVPSSKVTYNVIQKGLSTAPANWKMEVDGRADGSAPGGHFGRVICTFDGVDSRPPVRVTSPVGVRVQAGEWTKLHCKRQGDRFIVEVNGNAASMTVSGIGPITNTSPLTVGAKKLNDSDTFPGGIDDLTFWRS